MLRVELATQFRRLRTLVALIGLAAVPVAAGVATASSAGTRYNGQDGLFGAATFSAANHAMASLEFVGPVLLPIVVALLGAATGSADRDWGLLRYLYVAPVTRGRLLAGKLAGVLVSAAAPVAAVVVAGLAAGIVVFGWHPFHVIGAADLPAGAALGRVLAATGYLTLCMLSIAAIAFTLGLALPRGAEAVAAAIAFVVAASMLNAQAGPRGVLHTVAVVLPVHYWQSWTALLVRPGSADAAVPGLPAGVAVQLATVGLCVAVAAFVLHRRDPAA